MRRLSHIVVVCHQVPPWTLGGLAEYAERFLRVLRSTRPDLRVTLYTMPYPHRLPRWLKARLLGRDRKLFALALLLFHARAIAGLCLVRRAGTVVAVHDWQSAPVGLVAAKVLRLPVVYHVHSDKPDVGDSLDLIGSLQRLIGRVAARVIVPTPEMKAWLDVKPAHAVRVVPHGHEPTPPGPRPAGELCRDAGFAPDARLLVFAGRLSQVKGIHVLLRAMPEVLRHHPGVRLFVLGVGFPGTDQDAAVDRLVAELGLAHAVHVYHSYLPREQVYEHYRAAELCVFPSTFEPFGLVSVEAMALGVPVILGPGFSETIAHDGAAPTAFRLAQADPVALSRLIMSILDDPQSAARVGRRGREHVERSFTWPAAVTETVALYQEALTSVRSEGDARTKAVAPIGSGADRAGGPSGMELPAAARRGAATPLPDGADHAGQTAP